MNEYDKAGKILEQRRLREALLQEERIKEVSEKIPEYDYLTKKISQLNINYLYEMRSPSKEKVQGILDEIESLKEERENLLVQNGFSKDYTERKYFCEICRDEGHVNGTICKCKKDLVVKEKIKSSSLHSGVKEQNFQNFNFEIFSDEKEENKPLSPRDLAKFYYEEFKEYCENFSKDSRSLFISGPVGTGKTYFCNCISYELVKKNVNVVYLTAPDLMKRLRNYNLGAFEFEEQYRQDYDLILDSDLLIIDDLGSEQVSQYNMASLFNLINERLIRKKPVIISTNVSFNDIRDLYDERIYSRLKSYELCTMYGDDLRDKVY